MTMAPVKQGTSEWRDLRRTLITSTDLAVILGLSPFKCEADLADEKLHGIDQAPSLRMRVGSAVEGLIGEAYTEQTGKRVKRAHGINIHPDIEWAGASLDFRVVGERRAMEAKWTTSTSRYADGLPQDNETQVQWALGVTGLPRADVAVLLGGNELRVFPVEADPRLFADLVAIATDFRARLAAGGPFARDAARIKRDHPYDNGAEMVADDELTDAVMALVTLRAQRKDMEAAEERIETAIKARMGDVASLSGPGFRVTWKRTKDVEQTDWKSVADGLLRQLPETEAQALVGIHTTVRQGFRPFRVTLDKE